jgi:hypothetical protein
VFGAVVPAERGEEGRKRGGKDEQPTGGPGGSNPGPALEIGQGRGAALARARCRFPAVQAEMRERAAPRHTATHVIVPHTDNNDSALGDNSARRSKLPHDGRSCRTTVEDAARRSKLPHARSKLPHARSTDRTTVEIPYDGRNIARRSKCAARRLTVGHRKKHRIRTLGETHASTPRSSKRPARLASPRAKTCGTPGGAEAGRGGPTRSAPGR